MNRYEPINPKCPRILHGADYNPDQWMHTPEIWDEDMRLMQLAHCNSMSVGIFSWSALEPEEGRFEFGWLDEIMDKLTANGGYAVLATPSGSKPPWLSAAHPEVCRMRADGTREPHAYRHNHCRTSPIYREKCVAINTKLARRYGDHPALLVWHVSNEYNGGECFCPLCLAAFRHWLRERYHDDLDELNQAWWTGFWSHAFTEWDQILPVDHSIHGMMLDWRRFLTQQTIDFFKTESAPLREYTPDVPITTNFMGMSPTLNYWEFARELDVISWDSYPRWHDTGDDVSVAVETAFTHDINRCLKNGQPFMLMESVPSFPTRGDVRKRKRPGMHLLSSLQAVAHGSDTVQYFQWRKGRGGVEKLHGAVIDHCGHENTRVFRDVAQLGQALEKLDDVVGTTVRPEVAVIFDWENRWAVESAVGLGENVKYAETCISHYRPFWEQGVPVDVIDETCDFTPYRLLIAPVLYMLRAGAQERIGQFVAGGGTLVMTYWSGIVEETDNCYLGGFPGGGLRQVLGVWDEELDVLQSFDRNTVVANKGNQLGLTGSFEAGELCSLVHAEGAAVLATYGNDFYAGRPALTVNAYGDGWAYYVASRNERIFLDAFYGRLIHTLGLKRVLEADLPSGITAQMRTDGEHEFVFLQNFNPDSQTIDLGTGVFTDVLTGTRVTGVLDLGGYGCYVLEKGL
jgi:beta-galactosidase